MGTLWLSAMCRVCLASDREMFPLANTALEETYERVTSSTLVVEGRPCCMCGVCLSALRRCRRFIDTAREANYALDQWIRNQPNTDTLRLMERPLFSFTQSTTEFYEVTSHSSPETGVKQERDSAENKERETKGTSHENIKCEATSNDDNDNTQMSDNIQSHITQVLSYPECINKYDDMIDIENNTQISDNAKFDISEMLDNVQDGTAPGSSNVGRNQESSDEDIPLKRLRSRNIKKRNDFINDFIGSVVTEPVTIKLGGPALKIRRRITSSHRRGNTGPAAALHNERDTFSCNHCNYNTTNKYRLKAHLLTHTGENPFSCDKCDYKCIKKRDIKHHLLTHNGKKQFSCDECDYKCFLKGRFKEHLLTHTGEKPLSCDKCNYKCIQKSRIKQHLLTHTGEKPMSCDKCEYKCIRKGNLKRHLLTHAGEKQFCCDKCDYKCILKDRIKEHLLTHTGEKPMSCDKCEYKCIKKSNLKRHLFTHTGEKPFSCDKCNYKSVQKGKLKRHLLTHKKGKQPEKKLNNNK